MVLPRNHVEADETSQINPQEAKNLKNPCLEQGDFIGSLDSENGLKGHIFLHHATLVLGGSSSGMHGSNVSSQIEPF